MKTKSSIQAESKLKRHTLHTSSTPARRRKIKWIAKFDDYLCELVQRTGVGHWTHISQCMKKAFPGTTFPPKKCRERWKNHVNPDLIKGAWTNEEDALILEQ